MSQVVIKLLPDGSGRVRLHWFVRDPKGPIRTPGSTVMTGIGPLRMGGAIGRFACQPGRTVTQDNEPGKMIPFSHTDDPRAATCPECLATNEYAEMMKSLGEIMELPTSSGDVRQAVELA